MTRITLEHKKKFLRLRNEGKTLEQIADELGFSYGSARKLSDAYRTGRLQAELARATLPPELLRVESLLERAFKQLESGLLEEAKPAQILSFIEKALKFKSAYLRLAKEESRGGDEDLDEIWQLISPGNK